MHFVYYVFLAGGCLGMVDPMGEARGRKPEGGRAEDKLVAVLDDPQQLIEVMPRSVAESDNRFFANVLVFVFDPDGRLWIQRRPATATSHTGRWDVSACGAILVEEEPVAAAHRKLTEEMGLDCELQFVTTFDNRFEDEDGLARRRLSSVFIGITDSHSRVRDCGAAYDRIPVDHVVERVSAEPGAFVPSFLQEFAYAADAFNNRDWALEQSKDRHPAASWRHIASG